MNKEIISFSLPSIPLNIKTLEITKDKVYRGIHFHKEIELIGVDDGELICTVNDKKIKLGVGEALLIGRGVIHKIDYLNSNSTCTYIQIDIERFADFLLPHSQHLIYQFLGDAYCEKYIVERERGMLIDIFSSIKQLAISYDEPMLKAEICRLVALMAKYKLFPTRDMNETNGLSKILPTIKCVEKNYTRPITLDEACDLARMSKFYFCRLFKRVTGASFVEYLNFVRLYHAELELCNTDLQISEVAMNCGFTTIQYFNQIFKIQKGCTPREYRARLSTGIEK